MIGIFERQADILKLISLLDISPTLYKNANDKYQALAKFLEECDIEADMYPHGSFALGTVVRPSAKDPDAAYDLDFICQLRQTRDQISPSELRKKIEDALKSSDRYSGKLTIYEECFTIEYADINGIKFTIDIVPAADETSQKKQDLIEKSDRPDLLYTAIAIPKHNGNRNYSWLTNNPRGFHQWFEEINKPFLSFNREYRRREILNSNRMVFESVDDIPEGLERSSMQRVIQILKFHRDMFYQNLRRADSDDLKPISAIINTLVAAISASANPQSNVFELLAYVLDELNIYAQHQTLLTEDFTRRYGSRSIIRRSSNDRIWVIPNPADPEDNLADKWNKNPEIPKLFFTWVAVCSKDLINSLSLPDSQFRSTMDNAFGKTTMQKYWGEKYRTAIPTAKPIVTKPKPYRI
jgi:hypothetical protein